MIDPQDLIAIKRGSNVWLVARTSRDEADRHAVIHSAGAVLCEWLRAPSPLGFRGIFQILHASASGARFNIAAAKPATVRASQDEPFLLPPGQRLSGRSPIVRQVIGQTPWSVLVEFEWQGVDVQLPWPVHSAHVFGATAVNDLALDWLLLGAVYPQSQEEPRGLR